MAVVRSLLNGGVAEVDDETAKTLVESGHWVAAEAPAVKRRTTRAKAVAADSEE